ncbi:hypothetical protein Cch01nite_26830 [Cellulomonas chitinilytica]|uniref:Transporter n=1 Tax=Cellulomonas chitinilytica TaxID=398759 RepID=A0A919P6N2_9CELL|nr:hypothetical protein [Cellulomonas chitinilytica]GIG21959.1 hypothetical protein Cch01nite_26830 [Cellulomonas chitinilytica]
MDDETDPAPASAAEALSIISAQRRVARQTVPSSALLFLVWGAAWLVGYGGMWLSAEGDGGPTAPAAVLAGALGVAAVVTTIVHVVRRTRGITGDSARQGALYGWAWFVGFLAMSWIVGALGAAGASDEVVGLAANSVAALVVGLLYLAGGAMWHATGMYVLGAWIALVGAASAFAGLPGSYLWLSLAGGGGMLAAGVVETLRGRAAP